LKPLSPWAFVALALAAGTLAFMVVNLLERTDGRGGAGDEVATAVPAVSVNGTTAPVHDYVEFARALSEGRVDDSPIEASWMPDGLRKLAGALGALRLGDPDLTVDLRVSAEHFLLNPASASTTAAVRTGLLKAAAAIAAERPDVAASLHAAAKAIDEASPLTSQSAIVRHFLVQSAAVFERMTADARTRSDLPEADIVSSTIAS
jgi:HAMP domain-containing protein